MPTAPTLPPNPSLIQTILYRILTSSERGAKGQDKLLQVLRNSPLVRGPAGTAAAAGGAATGLAMRGFSGTVEMNRLNLEVTMISRELAGSFKPAIEFATKALMQFRKFLEKFGEREQNLLLLGGLAFGGLGAVGLARMGLGGLRGLMGGAAGSAVAGGVAGTVARSGLGAGLALPLALGAAAGASGYRNEVLGVAGAYGAVRGAYGAIGPMGGTSAGLVGRGALAGAARVAGPLAVGAIGYEASTGGYYSSQRARGHSKLVSGLASVGGGFMDLLSFGAYGDAYRKKYANEISAGSGPSGPNPNRRMATIADAGFDSSGSAFERISNRLSLVEANDAGGKDATTLLEDIKNFLDRTFGSGKPPPPPQLTN